MGGDEGGLHVRGSAGGHYSSLFTSYWDVFMHFVQYWVCDPWEILDPLLKGSRMFPVNLLAVLCINQLTSSCMTSRVSTRSSRSRCHIFTLLVGIAVLS